MSQIKAIIFDFDNTLVDYFKSDMFSLNKVIDQFKKKINRSDFIDQSVRHIMQFHKLVDRKIAHPLAVHEYRLEKTCNDFAIDYRSSCIDTCLEAFYENPFVFPGVENLLRQLQKKVKLAILTNSPNSIEQNIRIDKSNLKKYFNDIVIAADINYYKPQKEAFLHVANLYNFKPTDCLFIGDSEIHDIVGAKSAKIHSIKIDFYDNQFQTQADHVCNDYESLENILSTNYIIDP